MDRRGDNGAAMIWVSLGSVKEPLLFTATTTATEVPASSFPIQEKGWLRLFYFQGLFPFKYSHSPMSVSIQVQSQSNVCSAKTSRLYFFFSLSVSVEIIATNSTFFTAYLITDLFLQNLRRHKFYDRYFRQHIRQIRTCKQFSTKLFTQQKKFLTRNDMPYLRHKTQLRRVSC